MLKTLSITRLGSVGINSDIAEWDLDPNTFTDGKNFRLIAGSVYPTFGYADMSPSPIKIEPGVLINVNSRLGLYWVMLGVEGVYAYNGSNWYSIESWLTTPLSSGDEFKWTGANLGQIPIINNPQHFPEWWDQNAGTTFLGLPWDAAGTWEDQNKRCRVMRAHKNFLFALNLQESNTDYPSMYRWSHPADINGLPFTWDTEDRSSLAGKSQLGGGSGAIIDGLTLRDSFIIYAENGIHVLDFTGDEFVFKSRKLTSTYGLFTTNAVVEVSGTHIFLTDGDIVINNGSSVKSIMSNVLRKRLARRASSNYYDKSFVVKNDVYKEVWVCVPEDGSTLPNVAYVYNWNDNTWSLRDLPPNTAFGAFGASAAKLSVAQAFGAFGASAAKLSVAQALQVSTLTWDTWQGTWDEQTITWNDDNPGEVVPPQADFNWGIANDGPIYGFDYFKPLGFLNPDFISGSFIRQVLVNSVINEVYLVPEDGRILRDAENITLDSGGMIVSLTWDESSNKYTTTDSAFTNYVVTNNLQVVPLNITLDDAIEPPFTPVTASNDSLIGIDNVGSKLIYLDPNSSINAVNTTIERTNLPVDGHGIVTCIHSIIPHIQSDGPLFVQLGSHRYAGGPVTWSPEVEFKPTDRKVDIRTSGSLIAWRVRSFGHIQWEMSGMDIIYAPSGLR